MTEPKSRSSWMVRWALERGDVSGPINATAPHPVTNTEFSRAVGRAVHRPSWAPVPGFVLRTIVGEFAVDGLLRGQRVLPARARDLRFVPEVLIEEWCRETRAGKHPPDRQPRSG